MPVVFGENNVVWGTKTGQLVSERRPQLVNSDNNISFPRIF